MKVGHLGEVLMTLYVVVIPREGVESVDRETGQAIEYEFGDPERGS